jgi:hypothetical protein
MNARRNFLSGFHPVLVPPIVFGGLFMALWTWKCMMMVLFQNKIIYMPGLPPNARWEKISDYKNQCLGIAWKEERTRAEDGTQISLCTAEVSPAKPMDERPDSEPVYIVYFQGELVVTS